MGFLFGAVVSDKPLSSPKIIKGFLHEHLGHLKSSKKSLGISYFSSPQTHFKGIFIFEVKPLEVGNYSD